MFLLFGYLSIAVLQWIQQYRRKKRYSGAMLQALKRGSVLIQRGKSAQHGSVGALLNSPLLLCPHSYKETRIYSDDSLAISVVFPRQKVDLSEWTSYLDVGPGSDSSNTVVVLLEAEKFVKVNFVTDAQKSFPSVPVHVLQHGSPVAWKLGSPLGVILQCSYNNFVLLCDAFGQGRLILDKDFQLHRILSVRPTGKPYTLTKVSQRKTTTNSISNMNQEVDGCILKQMPAVTECSHALVNGVDHKNTKKSQKAEKDSSLLAYRNDYAKASENGKEKGKYHGREQNNENLVQEQFKEISAAIKLSVPAIILTNGNHSEQDEKLSSHLCTESDLLKTCSAADTDGELQDLIHKKDFDSNFSLHLYEERADTRNISVERNENIACEDSSFQNHTKFMDNAVPEIPVSPSIEEYACLHSAVTAETGNVSHSDSAAFIKDLSAGNKGDALFPTGQKFSGKPPNILVYCGKKDTARKFYVIKSSLEHCINTEAYSIYHLPHDQISTTPWAENAAALIISADNLYDNASQYFSDYLSSGGRILSFGSSIETIFVERREVQQNPSLTKFGVAEWTEVNAIQGRFQYVPGSLKKGDSSMDAVILDDKTGNPVVVLLTVSSVGGNGRAIFSQLFLECDPTEMAVDSQVFSQLKQSNKERLEVIRHLLSLLDLDITPPPPAQLTPCFLLTENQTLLTSLLKSLAGRVKNGVIKSRSLSLHFMDRISGDVKATDDVLPVITENRTSIVDSSTTKHGSLIRYFDPKVYWSHLKTQELGRIIFYTDVITTTMKVFEGFQFSIPDNIGVIAIAGRQTSGKGRGGNVWLSPLGCAMFTLPLKIPAESLLGQRVTFLQHMVTLSVVHGICSLANYQVVV
ncbi:biotin--protein ligase-like isoform X2 [Pomacea canaliculata]|uniref:biotin--protein ligase-like isoform X2 n=1 Tax=Pomacea canaliculata TaxID=400727 RepID=UPI000D72CECA|nr:biotin--protein ligase-like isoform X2 [Pomacea canaliculata]